MKKSKHSEAAKPQAAENTGRDAQGRFTAGNGGGPGNPFARRVAELRQVLYDCVSTEDLQAIVGKVVEQAKAGDLAAAKLLLQYLVGKPAAAVDPDTLDVHEMDLYGRAPAPGTVNEVLRERMPTELACNLLRTTLPYVVQGQADALRDELLKAAAEAAASANDAGDADDEDKADLDDDEVFARLEGARQAAANASARPASAAAPDARPTAAPSPNGPAEPRPQKGNGSTANGKHDPSANGPNNGHDGRSNKHKPFPFGS